MPLLPTLAIRLAVCAGVAGCGWRWFGAAGLVYAAPLFGVALARPILDAGAAWLRTTRRLAYGDREGRHHAHRGTTIDVVEDAEHMPWLRTDDVRRVLRGLPADAVLARLYPDGVRHDARQRAALGPPVARISAEALAECLRKATEPRSLRFARWLERDVAYAARRRRERVLRTARP